jgi:hypothetical protein
LTINLSIFEHKKTATKLQKYGLDQGSGKKLNPDPDPGVKKALDSPEIKENL